MQYGDEVQVLATGPIISRKALQPLGISDGSTCWGLWTGGLPVRNPNRFVSNWQLPHLIISPIHPEDWATSFHIRAVLRDNQGSLLRFLDSFKDCGVDLHFTDCAFGGYDHVVLNAIGQFDELRDWRRKFVDFYRENAKDFDKLWQRTDSDHASIPNANHFVYADALMKSLQVSAGPATQSSNEHQRQAKQGTEDLMRRHALEWLGRKMLGRMIALGIVIRLKEYELFHAAWDAEVADGKRPPIKQWKSDENSDMDPVGDYFFTSKAIQTGRRPWNIEMPFDPSWKTDAKSGKRRINHSYVHQKWDEYPTILRDVEEASWFKDGHEKAEKLFDLICKTPDLIHAKRDRNNKPRPTREAELALQQGHYKGWINAVLERVIRHNWILPYSSHTLYELAYTSIWQRNEEPLEFRYDGERSQLVVQNQDALRSAFGRFWNEGVSYGQESTDSPIFPRVAVASFNTKERFVRLKFVRRMISDSHIVNIDINFRVSRSPTQEVSAKNLTSEVSKTQSTESEKKSIPAGTPISSSRGLLRALCKTALDQKLDLLRASTRLDAKYPANAGGQFVEKGMIKLVGQLPRGILPGDLERLEDRFRSCIHDPTLKVPSREHLELNVKATPWQVTQVFWSSVFSHDRHDEIFGWASEIGKVFGLELVKTETHINEATKSVCDKLKSSDAMLQMVCLRDSDRMRAHTTESWQPEYVWLHTEYGMAVALDKPIVRVIDESMPERIRSEFDKVARDVPIESIDLRCSESTIRAALEGIMSELRSRLSDQHDSSNQLLRRSSDF